MKPKDTRTECQKESLINLLSELKDKYGGTIYGHRDFSKKDCPSFNAKKEYQTI
jgi:N-acetylmuramoyl-L-alanine amidase